MTRPARAWTHDPDAPVVPVPVGDVTVVPLVQMHYRADPALYFHGIDLEALDPEAWYWHEPYLDDGMMVIDIGGFAIRTPTRTVLVDAGMGNGKTRPNPYMRDRDDAWFATLRAAGITPADVDAVVFTHLHGDHVGYATRLDGDTWVPAFERARYLVSRTEYDYWSSAAAGGDLARLGDYMSDSVEPLHTAGVLDLVDSDLEIAPEVRLFAAPGHTPGNMCVEVSSRGERGVFSGDMVHAALQLAFPDQSTDYCVDQPGATVSRRELLADLAENGGLLFPAHFPDAVPGRLEPDDAGGYRYLPVGSAA